MTHPDSDDLAPAGMVGTIADFEWRLATTTTLHARMTFVDRELVAVLRNAQVLLAAYVELARADAARQRRITRAQTVPDPA